MKYKYLRCGAVIALALSICIQSLAPLSVKADTANDMNTAKSSLDSQISDAKAAGALVIRDDDKTINADTDDIANSKIAEDYNKQASNIKKQLADYQTQLNTYKKQLADYKKRTNQQGKVDGSELTQWLRMGDESNAKVTFTGARGVRLTTNKRIPPTSDGYADVPGWLGRWLNFKGATTVVGFAGNTSGELGTATWTNLSNAYYTKPSTGQEIKIGKITMTISNESAYDTVPDSLKDWMGSKAVKNGLAFFDNIAYGVWYINSDSIDVRIDFYDSDGKLINFDNNTAYLGFGSLNHWDYTHYAFGYRGPEPHFQHIECVQGLKNATGVNVAGSRVTMHSNNDAYSNEATNDDDHMWAAFAVSGSGATFRWHMKHSSSDPNHNQEYNFGTTIPAYSLLTHPTPPTLHYHYDKKRVKYTVTANYIGVKNGKKTTIADSTYQTVYTGDSYSTSAKSVTGWKLTAMPANATGTNVSSNITVNYYYAPIPVNLTVRHLDARTGKALASPTTTIKYYGDSYTTSPVAIRGFHVSTYPNNATGTIGISNVIVTYYYDRDRETVKANYKARTDSDKTKQEYGQTLADSVLTSGLYGDPYTTFAKTIAGWHLFETPRNATGNFTVDTPDVNYLYDRDTEVVRVIYVDTHGKTLAPTQTMVGLYGLPYKTEAANVSNYHLTAIPYNANGSYSTSPIDVKYVYDTNPSIQEGLSNSAVSDSNRDSILKSTSMKGRYSNTYHYVSKVTVGGSLTLDALNVSTTLTSGINPITKGKTINDQGIKVYEVGSHDKLQDVTNQGSLTYTVHGANVRSNNSANVAIDLDKSRVVGWTATTPRNFVGKTIYLDIPVTIPPDSSKLASYQTDSGISLLNSTRLIEKNDVSSSSMYRESTTSNKTLSSNSVETTLPNIYTAKVYKSIFNTASTINGKVYVKVYPNLVGKASGIVSNAVSVVSNGQTRLVDVPLSSKSAIVNATISSSKAANGKTFDVKLNSNRTSSGTSDLILTKSLIRSETSSNNVTTTTYNPDSSMYSSTTSASQYAPNKATGTDASGVESVETYYKQNANNSQLTALNEMQPLYVKLIEYMHSNHKSSVSAKAGYGIKNDVDLNYYGRHLNIPVFNGDKLATTFSTAKDLTSANGKSTSERNNPQSELMDYDLNRELASQLRSAVNSSSDKTATLNKYFKSGAASIIASNPINSDYMLDQASTDVSLPTPFANLSREQRDYVESVDKETHTSPTTPKLYTLAYKFNKRLLNNGIEYYDTSSSHVKNNNLMNKKSPSRSARDGGYRFYTNQWLALGNYATTYQSHPFGSNDFVFKLNRNLNIYAHRYLAKGDGENGDEYDDIAIQPVISTDLNSSNDTFNIQGEWEGR